MNEFRVLAEKSTTTPEYRDEKNRRVEFATPTFNVLNALEQMGYRVVTSGAFVTGHNKYDQREFVWTLHRCQDVMNLWSSSVKLQMIGVLATYSFIESTSLKYSPKSTHLLYKGLYV